MLGMDPLTMLRAVMPYAPQELQAVTRELTRAIDDRHHGHQLYPTPPSWCAYVFARASHDSGTSPALLSAIAGELTAYNPNYRDGKRAGLIGYPETDERKAGDLRASLQELADGSPLAAMTVTRCVRAAGLELRDHSSAGLLSAVRWYVERGRSACDPPTDTTVRNVVARYVWELAGRVPPDKLRELREAVT